MMITPWGRADHVERLAYGIVRVSTPSHGGYYVPVAVRSRIPEHRQQHATTWAGPGWYEEDLD